MATKSKAQETKQDDGWQTAHGGFPDVWRARRDGDILEATVISHRMGQYGMVWRVKTKDGIMALPNHSALMDTLTDNGINDGDHLRIECEHVGSRKKGDYYQYKVQFKRKADGDDIPF